jgi:hypothetical protein
MNSISRDPIVNAINNGIRRDIDIAVENECFRSALILIYSGIDAMAHLSRPKSREYNTPQDFKDWVKRYFHIEGTTSITPDEWWAARNGIVHTYTPFSKKHKQNGVRVLGYMVGAHPHIAYNARIDPNLVLVDILGMRDAFFAGIDKFLIDSFADPNKQQLMEKRINELILVIPHETEG